MKDPVNTASAQASRPDVVAGAGTPEGDARLVEAARRGDQRAFRALFERYQRKVFSIAYGFVRNPEDAMDLVQEAFVKVHRHLDTFQGNSSFYTWLYRITVNVAIDRIRRERNKRSVEYDDGRAHENAAESETPVVSTSTGVSPLRALRQKELAQKIDEASQKLSPAHMEILVLREVDGLSYEELAEVLDIPKGTVMSRLFHARHNLAKHLKDYLEE